MVNVARIGLGILALCVVILAGSPARADDLSTARTLVAKQVGLLKKGDVAGLKLTFTKSLRGSITADTIKKGQQKIATVTATDLVVSVEKVGAMLKVKMKNGTVASLQEEEGVYYFATVWFIN